MASSDLEKQLLELSPTLDAGPFESFRRDLISFNQRRNLVSRVHSQAQVEQLILESVAAALILPVLPGWTVLDIGTGGGFPGIPLALARPGCSVDLLERRTAACDFLRRELALLGLSGCRVLEGQAAEVFGRGEASVPYDLVTLKAVAPPRDALALARPFLGPKSLVALFRSPEWSPDPDILSDGWIWLGVDRLGVPPVGAWTREPRDDFADAEESGGEAALHRFELASGDARGPEA